MKIFFGAAIQGAGNREERAAVHRQIINAIKSCGCEVLSEHTTGKDYDATAKLLEKSLGLLPPQGLARKVMIRNKMIELIEGCIDAAVFEVSTPSLGTGIEIAHAYLRPRLGLTAIPVFALYQKNYWPNNLSTMIRGITIENVPGFVVKEYDEPGDEFAKANFDFRLALAQRFEVKVNNRLDDLKILGIFCNDDGSDLAGRS